jgi:hypothetical protein
MCGPSTGKWKGCYKRIPPDLTSEGDPLRRKSKGFILLRRIEVRGEWLIGIIGGEGEVKGMMMAKCHARVDS